MEVKQSTGITPRALLARVPMRFDCIPYKTAFSLLSTQRTYNQTGVQPIQVDQILAFLSIKGIADEDERELYLEAITEMDAVYLDYVRERIKKENP